MCLLQGRSITPELAGVCFKCCLYLSTCKPIIDHGFLFGECDYDYCCECPYIDECGTYGKEVTVYAE